MHSKMTKSEIRIIVVLLVLFFGGHYGCWRCAHPHDHPGAYFWDCARGDGSRR